MDGETFLKITPPMPLALDPDGLQDEDFSFRSSFLGRGFVFFSVKVFGNADGRFIMTWV